MALGECEAVALGVFGVVNAQDICVEDGDDIGDGKGGSDVADMRPLGLFEHDAA